MTDWVLERDLAGRATMEHLLDVAGLTNCKHVIDYGGGRGVWSHGFPTSTVYEPFPEEWGPPRDGVTFTDELDGIAKADGIILIGVQQLLSHEQTIEFLDFARDHLEPGGRILVSIPSVWMITGWLLRRDRPAREYPVWLWHLVNALRPEHAGSYATRQRVFLSLARQHGLLHTATLSRELDREYQQMASGISTGRWYHWLVFERAPSEEPHDS